MRWLAVEGVRLVRTSTPWAEPLHGAGGWTDWLDRATTATELERLATSDGR